LVGGTKVPPCPLLLMVIEFWWVGVGEGFNSLSLKKLKKIDTIVI
jgi:hypothetical protein